MSAARRRPRKPRGVKERRCVSAGCPLAGKGDRRCDNCTGPVVWIGDDGTGRGRPRSCHSCPMNGLGLPVCWACCPGPNEGFGTDGQSLVTMGGMEAPAEYLERNANVAIRPQRPESVTATLSPADESRAMTVLRRICDLDGEGWRAFVAAFRDGGAEGRRRAAAMIGASRGTFDGDGSPQVRLVSALSGFDAEDFCVLRQRMADASCTAAAEAMFVTKQAVSKREKRMRMKAGWYGAFLSGGSDRRDGTDGEASFRGKGDITPTGSQEAADKRKVNSTAHPHTREKRPIE